MEADVQSFSLKGYGIADDVEIAHTVPGDKILFELTRKKRLPKKGRLLEVLTPSQDRVTPTCMHAGCCGGCSWQQMSYDAQLKEKQKRVEINFGKAANPILSLKNCFKYRNKMEFSFSENRAGQKYLGLMIAQAEPYVFNLSECHLVNPWFSEIVKEVRSWWESSSIQAYFPPKDSGSLRYLTVREGIRTGQKMVVLNVSGNPDFALKREELDQFVKAVQTVIPDGSIFLRIHQTKKGTPTKFYEMHLAGEDHIIEELHLKQGVFSFKISPSSFFQPNTLGAELLYDTAISMLPKDLNVVFDLYCGTGTLGMAASSRAKRVIGIELSPEAVLDAEVNMDRNRISNMQLIQKDAGKAISELMQSPSFQKPDAVILDPPRAGLDELMIQHLNTLLPKHILYISCNPITQAKNVEELLKMGYQLKVLQPVDQFPHTYHIENIALLSLG